MRSRQYHVQTNKMLMLLFLGACITIVQASPVASPIAENRNTSDPSMQPPPTVGPSDTPDLSSTISRANIFGMFVTLQLCQLTQPRGSLLFQVANGWVWRVSPVSSFLEGCIIAAHLIISRDRPWESVRGFNVVARALLSVRNITEAIPDLPENHESLPESSTTQSSHSTKPHTDDLGGLDTAKLDGVSPADEEWRVTFFTTLSVFLVAVKLCAAKGTPIFAVAMAGLLFGWFMLQLLLFISQWSELTDEETERAIRLSKRLKISLSERRQMLLHSGVSALHVVLLMVGGVYISLTPNAANGKLAVAYTFLCILLLHIFGGISAISLTFVVVYLCTRNGEQFCIYLFCFLFSSWLATAAAASATDTEFGRKYFATMAAESIPNTSDSDIKKAMTYYVAHGFVWNILFKKLLLGLFGLIIFLFFSVSFHSLAYGHSHGASVCNFVLTVILFAIYLTYYDATGTYKPGWLDWLG